MAISPQGYVIRDEPINDNPFWDFPDPDPSPDVPPSEISPQGYKISIDPLNVNPFWGMDPAGRMGLWRPSVSESGIISWTLDDCETPPDPVDITGPPGKDGLTGPAGPPGKGVPDGGSIGQVLTKRSADDYDTYWANPPDGDSRFGNSRGLDQYCNGYANSFAFLSYSGTNILRLNLSTGTLTQHATSLAMTYALYTLRGTVNGTEVFNLSSDVLSPLLPYQSGYSTTGQYIGSVWQDGQSYPVYLGVGTGTVVLSGPLVDLIYDKTGDGSGVRFYINAAKYVYWWTN